MTISSSINFKGFLCMYVYVDIHDIFKDEDDIYLVLDFYF